MLKKMIENVKAELSQKLQNDYSTVILNTYWERKYNGNIQWTEFLSFKMVIDRNGFFDWLIPDSGISPLQDFFAVPTAAKMSLRFRESGKVDQIWHERIVTFLWSIVSANN